MTSSKARRSRGEPEITIEREACETDYTVLPNAIARDRRLKPVPGFVLYYILAKPPNWKVVPSEIASRMGLSLPAVRKALAALIKLGYGKRDLVRDDSKRIVGTRYFFASWPKYAEGEQPEADTGEAVSQKTVTRQNRATENPTPVLSNDSNKHPPKSPHAPGGEAAPPATPPQQSGQNSNSSTGNAQNPSSAPPDRITAGLPRGSNAETALAPVTLRDLKRSYEGHNSRKLAKADEVWTELSVEQQVHACAVLAQYFAHCARVGKRPVELWRYLRLGLFRQYAPPRKPGELPPPKELPPDPDAVLATEMGLRAAKGRWALELDEFIRQNRRVPDHSECETLARTGAAKHRELIEQVEAVKAKRLVAPMAEVFLTRRRNLIAKALRMHGLSPPDDASADPPATPHWPKSESEDFAELHYGSGR